MKAVKINMNEAKTSKSIKAVTLGIIVGTILILFTTVVFSVFLNLAGSLFEDFAKYFMLIPLILGGYTGGFVSARINGANGLILGLIIGVAVFIILLILGFSVYNTNITYMFLLKVVALLLPSAIGGIKGVNKKEKFKI